MTGGDLTQKFTLPNGEKLGSAFHIYGMMWTPGKIQFYIDTPSSIYATFTPADLPKTAHWPFDDGKFFLILNVAVGGNWPGSPDATSAFPRTCSSTTSASMLNQTCSSIGKDHQ